MNKVLKYSLLCFLVLCLVFVRVFLEPLFYDPFIAFFKNDYLFKSIPQIQLLKYLVHITIRFWMNTMISLLILYVLFNNTKTLFFSVKIYVVSFILLIFLLTLQLQAQLFDGYLVLFYIRRFLIHPVILLVLVPAFYYQQLDTSKI